MRVDADVDLQLVGGHGHAAGDGTRHLALAQDALDVVRGVSGAGEVVAHHGPLATKVVLARGVRGGVVRGLALELADLHGELVEERAHHVALREDAHELAVGVEHGEPTVGVVVEVAEREGDRHARLQHHEVARHVPLAGVLDPAVVKRVDDVVHRHDPVEAPILAHGQA